MMVPNFEPFKLTQTGPQEVVLEYPCQSFGFLFGEYKEVDDIGSEQVQEELKKEEEQKIEAEITKGVAAITCNAQE